MNIDLKKLEDSPHLLDMLIQMEDILDGLDIYVFRNWLEGEIVEGPIVRPHWVSFSLLYPNNKMPDPKACLRLMKHGVKVQYDKVHREMPERVGQQSPKTRDGKEDEGEAFWMIKISFPKRLIEQNAEAELDMYDDIIDADDVEEAKDSGLDDESAYQTNNFADPGAGAPQQ